MFTNMKEEERGMKKKFLLKRGLVIMLSTALLVGQPSMVMAADAVPQDDPVLEETESGLEEIGEVDEETEEASDEDVAEEETEDNGSESEEETEENASEEETEENVSEEDTEEESADSELTDSEEESEEELEIVEEIEEETDIAEVAEKMFPGVTTKNLTITASDRNTMVVLKQHASEWSGLIEGVDCAPSEITYEADSWEDAEEIAAAYNATLVDCQYGWALATLNADPSYAVATVEDAVKASVEFENILTPVWPNYYRYTYDEPVSGDEMDQVEIPEEILDDTIVEELDQISSYNDPFLKIANSNYQWEHYVIGSDIAWMNGYTGSGVKVGVIDTGFISGGHEDVSLTRVDIKSATGSVLSDTVDHDGHGTHVCGIIRESANNSKGGVGVAPGCTLYIAGPTTYDSKSGEYVFDDYYIKLAIEQLVANQKVDIINMSLGGPMYGLGIDQAITTAYNNGVAVFCAAGNENTNALHYPAGCAKAISVGAVDRNLGRAIFSNYGSKVKFSAPGVDIVSTYTGSTSAYKPLSGTSMACPVVAGEAAVILGAMKNTTRDKTRVEALIKAMNKGAVSPKDSGLGKIVNLPKALGLSNWNAVPVAPTFVTKAGTFKSATTSVTISAEKQSVIYYSTDGKSITYKDGKLSANAKQYTSAITVGNQASVTVYAIAINNTTKVASKCVSAKYVFKPNASSVDIKSKSGVTSVAVGKSLALVGTITPAYSPEKTLVWSISPADGNVKVDSKGKVTAAANAKTDTYTVKAAVKGRENVYKTMTISVVKPTKTVASITSAKKSYSVLTGETTTLEAIKVTYSDKTTASQTSLIWTVDKTGCSFTNSANGLSVKCSTAGTYTLTGTSTDGTGKTIVLKVTAKDRVSSINGKTSFTMVQGKSISLGCSVSPEKAGKKLSYTISPADKGVTVSSAGKVTATSTATTGSYTITVKALDGSGVMKTISLNVRPKLAKYSLSVDKTKVDIFRVGSGNKATVKVSGSFTACICTVDKPEIATASYSGGVITITSGGVAGTATVTFSTTDGSNLKKTIKVTNHNPISGFIIAPMKGQFSAGYGKSMKLGVTYFEEYGKVDAYAKKLTWSTADKNLATVDQSGKVVGKSHVGNQVTITATSISGAKRTYDVYVSDAITSMWLVPYDGGITTNTDGKKVGVCVFSVSFSLASKDGKAYQYFGSSSSDLKNCVVQTEGKYLYAYVQKKGDYTITASATDGSGKKASKKIFFDGTKVGYYLF